MRSKKPITKSSSTEKPATKPATETPDVAGPTPPVQGAGWSTTLILGVVLMILVIVLAVQNTESTHFQFLGWDANSPLLVLLLISALIGVVFDEIAGLLWRHRRRRQIAEREELLARRPRPKTPSPKPS